MFNKGEGGFLDRDLYVFCANISDGKTVALGNPNAKQLLGVDTRLNKDANGKPLAIDGLWTLTLGGGRNSNSDALYFTAGPNDETNGLFGTITPASKQ